MSVFLDLDLLLDLRYLQFCVARTGAFLESSSITELLGRPLLHTQRIAPLLRTVKPRLHGYSLVTALSNANRPSKVFSFAEELVARELLTKFPWVPQPVTYVTLEDCVARLSRIVLNTDIVLVHVPQIAASLRASGVSCHCVPLTKHQGAPMRSLLTAVPGLHVNALEEYRWWKSFYPLPVPVRLSGTVVRGFGKGSAELGFPTANIEPEQPQLAQLVPGVYSGRAWLDAAGQVYKAAVSIGWNPQYDNSQKTTEVHLLHTFEEPLYGKELTVQLDAYVRAESTFESVADLITAIRYDVRLTEEIINIQ